MLYLIFYFLFLFFFFFNDTATTEIYTLSLHDALPIWLGLTRKFPSCGVPPALKRCAKILEGAALSVKIPPAAQTITKSPNASTATAGNLGLAAPIGWNAGSSTRKSGASGLPAASKRRAKMPLVPSTNLLTHETTKVPDGFIPTAASNWSRGYVLIGTCDAGTNGSSFRMVPNPRASAMFALTALVRFAKN